MNNFGYDPEASIQDADIEMAEFREAARRSVELRKAGKCQHDHTGPDSDGPDGQFTCYYCGKVWANMTARDKELWGA